MRPEIESRIRRALHQPVDGAGLGLFRLLWGLLMCAEVNWLHNQLHDMHQPDVVHFYYQGFSWIRHFPERWMMEIECVVMLLSAVLMAAGFWFRAATVVFTITYAHFFFSQAITYNNHFYLIILVAFLLAFTKADERFSIVARVRAGRGMAPRPIPLWNYQIIRLQVVIVYLYGAIAKIDHDWLVEMEPVRFWLEHSPYPSEFLSRLIRQDWFVPLTAWGGFLIDLICPVLLLIRRTRPFAILILVSFHGLNSQIFNIGYFPLIGVLLIFPFLHPSLWRWREVSSSGDEEGKGEGGLPRKLIPAGIPGKILVVFFVFQLLFPLRWHLWRPANPLWTDKGQRFAWRMMLREKIADLHICFADPEVRKWLETRPGVLPVVSPSSRYSLGQNPYHIWQYVQEIKRALEPYGKGDTPIHVLATCSLNGRPYHPLIDPNVDLAKADCPFFRIPSWIVPLPDELKVDYDQIQPISQKQAFSEQAMRAWVEKNPGPATKLLEEYRRPVVTETPLSDQRP